MRNKVAKRIKRIAEGNTVGMSKAHTQRIYRRMKKNYVRTKAMA